MAKITEHTFSDETLQVDESAGVIYNVRILGRQSVNGREYSDRALEDAARLYSGADIYIDHLRDKKPGSVDRGLLEGFGVMNNPRRHGDEVRGDLHYLKSHEAAGPIVERAKRFPKSFGLSHDAEGSMGKAKTREGKDVVESLTAVRSIDLVKRPATNRGLFEDQPTESTIRAIAEKHAATDQGKLLVKLIEADASNADEPVSVDIGMNSEQEISRAFEAMLLAVFRSKLDSKVKLAQFRAILGIQDETEQKTPTPESVTVDGKSVPAGGEKPGDTTSPAKLSEADQKRLERLEEAERRNRARDLVEADGRNWRDLSDQQRKLLEAAADEAAAKLLLETWPKAAAKAAPAEEKPRMRSMLESTDPGKEKYEDLREQIRPRTKAK